MWIEDSTTGIYPELHKSLSTLTLPIYVKSTWY
jgi:hypothetical protein